MSRLSFQPAYDHGWPSVGQPERMLEYVQAENMEQVTILNQYFLYICVCTET